MRTIQVLPDPTMLHALEISGADGPHQVVHIDLSSANSKSTLLEAIRAGMKLPDYFGCNWDALEECLRDLKEDKGWLLVFENADGLLLLPKPDLSTFLAILSDTAEFWKNDGRLFRIAFIGSSTLAAALGVGGGNGSA